LKNADTPFFHVKFCWHEKQRPLGYDHQSGDRAGLAVNRDP
jgi:hypothetical protein